MHHALSQEIQLVQDEQYMRRCLVLAQRGAGKVSPNPMVGAVIVLDHVIIGEGWHKKYGQAHAEVNAIVQVENQYGNAAAEMLSKATIYVSLEPCAHHGKTPPCADLIIRKDFAVVVIGCRDPFLAVNGKGIERIAEAKIPLRTGILEKDCRDINRRFFTSIEKQRPYVILKWATSADGFISPLPHRNFWLSSGTSQLLSHKWRSEEDSILVGKNTARLDNPELTVRNYSGKNPVRLVVDWNLELVSELKIFNEAAPTLIFNGIKSGQTANIRFIHLEFRKYLVPYLLYQCYLLDLRSVIVEGGRNILVQFIASGLWDEARVFKSPILLHEGIPEPTFHFSPDFIETSGNDTLQVYRRDLES